MRISGTVITAREIKGHDDNSGEDYAYWRANILDDDTQELVDAKVGPDFGPVAQGEKITAVIRCGAYRRDGRAVVSVLLVRNLVPAKA